MGGRKGTRIHKAFAADCDIRVEGKVTRQKLAYRGHAESEVRKKISHRLTIVKVYSVTEITEAEYDELMQSKKFPEGLKDKTEDTDEKQEEK